MRTGPGFNLGLEAGVGCLFLVFVFLVGLMGLLAANWIGMELWAVANPMSVTDRILFRPRSYLTGLALLLIPSVVIGLAILGIRLLLVQPEPPPWIDGEQDSAGAIP